MKRLLFSTVALLALAACGHTSSSPVASAEDSVGSAERVAFPMSATLGDVKASAAQSPASGLWTTVEVQYQVPCTQKLESFSYDLRSRDDGGTDLVVSGIGTKPAQQQDFACQSIALETKTVTVPGLLTADQIHLVNLTGSDAAVPATHQTLQPIGLELVATHDLCPAGSQCVLGGTVVELKTTTGVSCVDSVEPVTYAVDQNDANGKVKLAVSAIHQIDSRMVRCAAFPKTIQITLPMVFVAQADIDLTVVGGN